MKVKRYSVLALFVVILLSLFFGWEIQYISFDHDLEKFFPAQDPETQFFEQYREKYENDNDFILVGLVNESGIFDQDFLLQVDSLTNLIQTIPEVSTVYSPTQVKEYVRFSLDTKLTEIPFLQIDQPENYSQDSTRIFENPSLVDFLFSSDQKSVLLYIKHAPKLDETACFNLSQAIDNQIAKFNFPEVHIAGKCFGQTFFVDLLHNELTLFLITNFLMIVLLLFIFYRSFWGVLLPLLVVGLATLWTVGTMALLGISLDLLTNIIPTILMVIGISDVIHLFTHYLGKRDAGFEKIKALKNSIKEVGMATLITSLTTAIGFLSLSTSSFTSLIEMGLFSTVGLIYAFFLTYTVLPALIALYPDDYFKIKFKQMNWEKSMNGLLEKILANSRTVMIASAGIFLIGIWGISQMKVNNYLLGDLKDDHPQRLEFSFFEEKFGGARPFEMEIVVKDDSSNIFSKEVLLELEKVDSFLTNQYGVKNLISPPIIIKQANQIYHSGRERYYKIPTSANLIKRLSNQITYHAEDLDINRYLDPNLKAARISGKIPDWGTYIDGQKNEAFFTFLAENNLRKNIFFKLTGTGYLMDLNNTYLVQNVIVGLVIAIIIIGFLFAFWFRSGKMFLLTLIPNLLPLLFIAGIMGIFGITLKISTAIIFIISFGIAVDDSIHFLTRFKHELKNNSVRQSVKNAYSTTGKAIVITSLILVGGFSTLCFSDFLGTFYIGFLISLTLLMALIADLVLLPILLVRYFGDGEDLG